METLQQQETKAILEMGKYIEFLEKECEALRSQVQDLQKQLYGSR
jgi:chaperonin cofactor prefoldin